MAMAAHNSGGRVMVQVEHLAQRHSLPPRRAPPRRDETTPTVRLSAWWGGGERWERWRGLVRCFGALVWVRFLEAPSVFRGEGAPRRNGSR